jgi:hypothetical protein
MRTEYSVRRPIPSRCHMKPASSPSSPGRCGERFLGPPAAVWVPRTPRPRNPPSAPKPTAAKRAPDGIGEAGLLHDLDAASHVAGPGFGQPDEVVLGHRRPGRHGHPQPAAPMPAAVNVCHPDREVLRPRPLPIVKTTQLGCSALKASAKASAPAAHAGAGDQPCS